MSKIKLTEARMIEFFPDDNRFLHFVAKKHGLFFLNSDDEETARFIAIRNVMLLISGEFEFKSEAHLMSVMELNFKRAIHTMMQMNDAKKRSMDIRTESEFIKDGREDERSILETSSDEDDSIVEETRLLVALNESEETSSIYNMWLNGYTDVELSKIYNISSEAVRQRRVRVFKKLKNYYETNEWNPRKNVKEVRTRVRYLSTSTYKAEQSDYTEAMSYLNLTSEI